MEHLSRHFSKETIQTANEYLERRSVTSLGMLMFSPSVVSSSLQHARLPCASPSPRACSNSCPLSQGCHPTISSPVVPFSSCLQSCSASGAFLKSWLFASCGQSTGASASTAVQGTLKSLLQHHSLKASIL